MKRTNIILAALALATLTGCVCRQGPAACPAACPRPAAQTACVQPPASEAEIAALFDRWNLSLQSGDPRKVVANYAERSVLLPTLSGTARLTPAEKEDYFRHFLENRPSGTIDLRQITVGPDIAVDTGHYTFTFAKTGAVAKGRYSFTYRRFGATWLIVSHHSSLMPQSH